MRTFCSGEVEHWASGWPLPSDSVMGVACMGLRALLQEEMGDWSGETKERDSAEPPSSCSPQASGSRHL